MDLRVQLIQQYREGQSISALPEIYEVSRKTIYKWPSRHAAEDVAGLIDLCRTPRHSPGKISEEVIALIVAARQPRPGRPTSLQRKAWGTSRAPASPEARDLG